MKTCPIIGGSPLSFFHRWRLQRAPGMALGRLTFSPLAASTLCSFDLFVVLCIHKQGPCEGIGARYYGMGEQWHACQSLTSGCQWREVSGQTLYTGLYNPDGEMILVRTASDRSHTIVRLGEEEGCDGIWTCELCQARGGWQGEPDEARDQWAISLQHLETGRGD